MAGHSKWANIKHRKGRQDAKRGKVFTKLIRELTVAAKQGASPSDNPRLRLAVDKALTANMTRDTIDRAIARGAGLNESDNMLELVYEGYGTDGVAIIVETMTDNKNRTAAEIRHTFSKFGGNLGTDGSVSFLFERKGLIKIILNGDGDEEQLIDDALDAGADDVINNQGKSFDVLTGFSIFLVVKSKLEEKGYDCSDFIVGMIPNDVLDLNEDVLEKAFKLIDALEDLDDVQNVYSNVNY